VYFDEYYSVYTARRIFVSPKEIYTYSPEAMAAAGTETDGALDKFRPPLGNFLISLSMRSLGDRVLAWRLPSLLAGSLSVVLLYLVIVRLGFPQREAVTATFLYNFSLLAYVFSRVATLDSMLTAGVLLTALLAVGLRHRLDPVRLLGVGMSLGAALAIKWSALFLLIPLAFIVFLCPSPLRTKTVSLIIITGTALLVYFLIFLPFLTEAGPGEFLRVQAKMFSFHSGNFMRDHPLYSLNLNIASPWWRWPLWYNKIGLFYNWRITGTARQEPRLEGSFIFSFANLPLLWGLTLANLIVLLKKGASRFRPARFSAPPPPVMVLSLSFFALWLPWLFSPRPTFVYYFLPAIPFGVGVLAWSLNGLIDRRLRILRRAYFFLVTATFFLLYPLVTAVKLPPVIFQILDRLLGPMQP
jgi:dolichyl-phosphate-mannose--protein O-mannosyl transferase